MLGDQQRHRVFAYLLNTASRLDCREDAARGLMSWIDENASLLRLGVGRNLCPSSKHPWHPDFPGTPAGIRLTSDVWATVRDALREGRSTRRPAGSGGACGPTARGVRCQARTPSTHRVSGMIARDRSTRDSFFQLAFEVAAGRMRAAGRAPRTCAPHGLSGSAAGGKPGR